MDRSWFLFFSFCLFVFDFFCAKINKLKLMFNTLIEIIIYVLELGFNIFSYVNNIKKTFLLFHTTTVIGFWPFGSIWHTDIHIKDLAS